MTTVNLTTAETHVLKAIALDEMNSSNGAYPSSAHDVYTWVDSAAWTPYGWEVNQVRGVLSSLVKKGLAKTNGESIWFTDLGYQVFTEVHPKPE